MVPAEVGGVTIQRMMNHDDDGDIEESEEEVKGEEMGETYLHPSL